MKYTVAWTPSALDELAVLWSEATDRLDVTEAANHIDHSLRTDPYSYSESREDDFRILFLPPLAILFQVSEDDRMVSVKAVWRPV